MDFVSGILVDRLALERSGEITKRESGRPSSNTSTNQNTSATHALAYRVQKPQQMPQCTHQTHNDWLTEWLTTHHALLLHHLSLLLSRLHRRHGARRLLDVLTRVVHRSAFTSLLLVPTPISDEMMCVRVTWYPLCEIEKTRTRGEKRTAQEAAIGVHPSVAAVSSIAHSGNGCRLERGTGWGDDGNDGGDGGWLAVYRTQLANAQTSRRGRLLAKPLQIEDMTHLTT